MTTRRSLLVTAAAAIPALPAIAQLKSRRAEAKPITPGEREARIERARELMTANKLDAICLSGGTSLRYFTGIRWGTSERLFACVLPRKGDPFYVCPAFEEERAREQAGDKVRVLTWQEDEDPYALVGKGLASSAVRIGMEERTIFAYADGIAHSNRGATVVSATPVTAGCRAVKSPAELDLLKLANNATLEAYRAGWKQVREGMTNRDLTALIEAAYQQFGFPGNVSVQMGEFSALPHGSARPQQIREGSLVMMDDGCSVEGYTADVTRTVVFGKPSEKMKRVWDIVHRAQSAALAAAKPGAPCENVDMAARKVIEEAGFGPGYKYFTHRLGHGIGLDGHEWPYLVRGNKQLLAPGMTFSDEPGVYIRGEFGMRHEDCMYITDKGAELFTPQCESLEQGI
ncbi:MAG: Xaa-Pro dipeptidase [Bryobacterales bacterium]|jgi:Xaa-Pro dipeptidase|nr:Xaa-Pro dipeptidase [Bryobacterales bacterium]